MSRYTSFSTLESSGVPLLLSQCKMPVVIKFLSKEQVGAHIIHRRLFPVYGEDNVMAIYNVYRWAEMFFFQ